MVFTPSPLLLKLLYTRGSLHNRPEGAGVAFSIKNRLDTVRLTGVRQVRLGGQVVPAEKIKLDLGGGEVLPARQLDAGAQALELPVGRALTFVLDTPPLPEGMHQLQDLAASSAPAGASPEVWPATTAAQDVSAAAQHDDTTTYREPLA